MYRPLLLISACFFFVRGQCPWPNTTTALNSVCTCNYRTEGDPKSLDIDCNNVNFKLFIDSLKNATSEESEAIQRLHVTNTTIGILPDGLFNGTKITALRLTKCQIRIIGENAFEGIGSKLRILDLQDNYLTSVPSKALKKIPSLSSLDLSRNQIGSLQDGSFKDNPLLENIELADNELIISDSAFSGLEGRLNMLNLKGTEQTEIPVAILNVTSLKQLDLAQNKIGKLKPRALASLRNLEWLNLERNRILQLNKDSFDGIGNTLRTLSLLNNILLSFPKEALAKLVNLRTLDIGFNGIRKIPDDAFSTIKFLSLIAIEGNPLSTIPLAAFAHLKDKLLGFSFGGRYLVCDCRVKWIAEWIRDINIQVTSRERNPQFCGSPEKLQTMTFYQINANELKCKEPLTTTTTTTTTVATTTTSAAATSTTTTESVENKIPEEDILVFDEPNSRPSTPIVLYPGPTFKNAGPPLIPPPPPPILRVGDIPPRPVIPNIKNNKKIKNKPKGQYIQEIDVTKAERKGSNIVVEWDALINNVLGYQVMYRTFGATKFKKSQQLSANTRYHILNNIPDDQCCFVVCVVATEDANLDVESVPRQQCIEIETDETEESSTNMDMIIIGVSAGICFLIVIAIIIFCICSCSRKKKNQNQKQFTGHPPIEPLKMELDWDRTSMYSARSIPRARLYHDTKSNGSINNDYLTDDNRSYSLSHIPNGYHDNYSRSMMPDMQSQRSASRNSYIPHIHQPSLGRQSAHSMSQLSTRHSQIGLTPPVEQRRKRLDRVGRVGGISAASSLHSLTSYEQDPAIRHENWNDHDMEIYVGRNHVAQPNSKNKAIYR